MSKNECGFPDFLLGLFVRSIPPRRRWLTFGIVGSSTHFGCFFMMPPSDYRRIRHEWYLLVPNRHREKICLLLCLARWHLSFAEWDRCVRHYDSKSLDARKIWIIRFEISKQALVTFMITIILVCQIMNIYSTYSTFVSIPTLNRSKSRRKK